MSFRNRLARLEKVTASSRAAADAMEETAAEQNSRLQAAWAVMQQSMSEEHARLVVEAYAAGAQYVQSPEFSTPAGRLLRRCLDAMSRLDHRHWPYTDLPDEVILTMPSEVAEVYLKHDALPLHDCEDCGFRVPVTPGEYRGRPAVRHFENCPVCGGRTGYSTYFNRRQEVADADR